MTLGKAAVTHLMFIDDLPLVLGIGIFQHGTVGGRMIVGTAIFGAPCAPTIMCFGRIVIASLGIWQVVARGRRSSTECRSIRRASPFSANYVTILFVSSRGASLDLGHGASRLLGLGSLVRTNGRGCRSCSPGHSVRRSLT